MGLNPCVPRGNLSEISGQEHIEEVVRRRRLRFFGHVARMADDVPTKTILRTACLRYPGWHIHSTRMAEVEMTSANIMDAADN